MIIIVGWKEALRQHISDCNEKCKLVIDNISAFEKKRGNKKLIEKFTERDNQSGTNSDERLSGRVINEIKHALRNTTDSSNIIFFIADKKIIKNSSYKSPDRFNLELFQTLAEDNVLGDNPGTKCLIELNNERSLMLLETINHDLEGSEKAYYFGSKYDIGLVISHYIASEDRREIMNLLFRNSKQASVLFEDEKYFLVDSKNPHKKLKLGKLNLTDEFDKDTLLFNNKNYQPDVE